MRLDLIFQLKPYLAILIFFCAIGIYQTAQSSCGTGSAPTTVRVIVPASPGNSSDVAARTITDQMRKLDSSVNYVIENSPGAGGSIAVQKAVDLMKSNPNTLLFAQAPDVTLNSYFYGEDFPEKNEIRPVSYVGGMSYVLVCNPKVNAKTAEELVKLAKGKDLNFGSGGFTNMTGVQIAALIEGTGARLIVHDPHKGTSEAMNDVLFGHNDCMFQSISTAKPHIDSGKLRAFAVTARSASPLVNNVPFLGDVPGVHFSESKNWFGFFGSGRLESSKEKNDSKNKFHACINDLVQKALTSQVETTVTSKGKSKKFTSFSAYLSDRGFELATITPQEFQNLYDNEYARSEATAILLTKHNPDLRIKRRGNPTGQTKTQQPLEKGHAF